MIQICSFTSINLQIEMLTLQSWVIVRQRAPCGASHSSPCFRAWGFLWGRAQSLLETNQKTLHLPRWWICSSKTIIHCYLDTLTGFMHQVSMTTQLEGLVENGQQRMMSLPSDWQNPNQNIFRFNRKTSDRRACAGRFSWITLSWMMSGQKFDFPRSSVYSAHSHVIFFQLFLSSGLSLTTWRFRLQTGHHTSSHLQKDRVECDGSRGLTLRMTSDDC